MLSEHVTWIQIAGGSLVAAGIYLVNRTARRDRTPGRADGGGGQSPRSSDAFSRRMRRRASSVMGTSSNSQNHRSSGMKG